MSERTKALAEATGRLVHKFAEVCLREEKVMLSDRVELAEELLGVDDLGFLHGGAASWIKEKQAAYLLVAAASASEQLAAAEFALAGTLETNADFDLAKTVNVLNSAAVLADMRISAAEEKETEGE